MLNGSLELVAESIPLDTGNTADRPPGQNSFLLPACDSRSPSYLP